MCFIEQYAILFKESTTCASNEGWFILVTQIKFVYRKVILVFKSLNQLVPEYLNMFKYVHQVSTRSTRQSSQNLLYVPKSKSEYYKRSFIISGSYLWNDLSENLKECTTIESFKELQYTHTVLWLVLHYIVTQNDIDIFFIIFIFQLIV